MTKKVVGFLFTVAGGYVIGKRIAEEVAYLGLRTAVNSAMDSALETAKANFNNN